MDTMRNIHPVYNIKELMIKQELAKNPDLATEDWSRFLPQFTKRNVQRKKMKTKTAYTPFPPDQQPRKEDLLMESGEYFLTPQARKEKQLQERKEKQKAARKEKEKQRSKSFQPPEEPVKRVKFSEPEPSIEELRQKFMRKGA